MQSIVLAFIHRCSFVYMAVILTAVFSQGLVEASGLERQTGVVTAPDGVPIHYSTYGTGSPTLVFIHGISCDQSYWKEQVKPFSRSFQIVTVDLAGHGDSGMGRKNWSMEAFGGDVAAVVKDLDLQDVVLIGHSMGGAVIFKAARQLPERVKGLVAVDTYEDFSTWYTAEENEAFIEPFREDYLKATRAFVQGMFVGGTDQAWMEQIVKDMQASPPEVMIPSMESALELMYGHEVTTLLQGLDIPVIVINSDLGSTEVESMKRDGVEVHIIQGVGHFLILEDPDAFNSLLTNVIKSLTN
jgi:pimeloyl-ACP methyl ester carboxylesterase